MSIALAKHFLYVYFNLQLRACLVLHVLCSFMMVCIMCTCVCVFQPLVQDLKRSLHINLKKIVHQIVNQVYSFPMKQDVIKQKEVVFGFCIC